MDDTEGNPVIESTCGTPLRLSVCPCRRSRLSATTIHFGKSSRHSDRVVACPPRPGLKDIRSTLRGLEHRRRGTGIL